MKTQPPHIASFITFCFTPKQLIILFSWNCTTGSTHGNNFYLLSVETKLAIIQVVLDFLFHRNVGTVRILLKISALEQSSVTL